MADVFSLYPQSQPNQTPNLLANPGQAINMLQGLTTLQQQQLELQGQRAMGQIYQQHVTPDGVDVQGIMRDASQNPAAAYVLPQYTTGALAQRGQMINNATNWVGSNAAQSKPVMDFLSSLDPNSPTLQNDVLNGITTLKRILPSVPGSTLAGIQHAILDDPQGPQHGLLNMRNQAIGPAGISTRVPGMPTAGGAPTSTTMGAANLAGSYPTGTPPGTQESAGVMQADLARAHNYSTEIFPWQQALQKMESMQAQGETFGPGSKGRQELQSFAYALSPTVARWAGVDPDKITNYAEVEKYLTQGLQQRAAGFGTHTDMQLATAASGSPNVHITDLAGIPLVKATIALRRMEQAQTIQNAKLGAPNYTANTASWATRQDPRAYMIDMMQPDQIKQLQTTLKGADRARFNASLRAAIQSGVITPPGQ